MNVSCARCGRLKLWSCACLGERAMEGQLTAYQTQMSFMDQTEPFWCECTQDMSGYVLPDITLPLSDEDIQFEFSTAQHENDIDVQNSENPLHEELILEDSFDAVSCEDSNMFDNSNNYNLLDTKIKAWLPKISNTEIDEFAKTSMLEDNGDFRVHTSTENPPILTETPKVEKKLKTNINKKSSYLSIFECEEPVIKEDLESLSSCCTDYKLAFELRDEMEVAEEVVVTTEYYDEQESKTSPFFVIPDALESPVKKVEDITKQEESSFPVRDISKMEEPYDIKLQFEGDENFLYSLNMVNHPVHETKVTPKLHLDIAAAMETSSQLLLGTLPDTPDVLKPVLSPGLGFDLVNYLLTNNSDSNNNTTSSEPPSRTCTQESQQRKGKSKLSLAELKESLSRGCDEQSEPIPGPSKTSSSQRPARKSATKFKKHVQDGFLNTKTVHYDSSDEEEYVPKIKQAKTSHSSSSRKRLNSDSDQFSISEDAIKYRERRDRNNISSKRSRQKRKVQQELKKMELKDLEEENRRLKRRAESLAATLQRVHSAWKDYLKTMNKEKF